MGVFVNIIMANTVQVGLSLLYVANNGVLSCMLVAKEWCGFAKTRKTLRVSSPVGIQRSSYFLSMPLRYGIPMMAYTSFLHWLVSQCIFIIRVNTFGWDGNPGRGWTTTGYSFIPSLIGKKDPISAIPKWCLAKNITKAVNLYLFSLIIQIVHGHLRKYPSEDGMPLASTCSAAISAACHRPEEDKEAHLLPIQWGVVTTDDQNTSYCSFSTSRTIAAPCPGASCLGVFVSEIEKQDSKLVHRMRLKFSKKFKLQQLECKK